MAEYSAMFKLSNVDLKRRILGCGDGPASFNAEMSSLGRTVVSTDPLYSLAEAEIRLRSNQTFNVVMK